MHLRAFPGKKELQDAWVTRAAPAFAELINDLIPVQQASDLPDLFAALARALVRSIRADACSVSLSDEARTSMRAVGASVVPPARLRAVSEAHPLQDFPASRRVLETGQFVDISASDIHADAGEKAVLHDLGFGRVLICPLVVEGERRGLIHAYRTIDRPFRRDDPRQVEILATFAANAYGRIVLSQQVESQYTATLAALASALEAKDPYTQEHTGRIREIAAGIGAALRLSPVQRRALALGAVLHDVGKIGISDSILLKPGPLTGDEWAVMRTHPEIGERMLTGIDFLSSALPIIRHHHERWDGTGYPDALGGSDIPIAARIVAVCDAFDAMTSNRPYRSALGVPEACEQLIGAAGKQFDPAIAALLVDVVSSLGEDNLEERFVRYASSH